MLAVSIKLYRVEPSNAHNLIKVRIGGDNVGQPIVAHDRDL